MQLLKNRPSCVTKKQKHKEKVRMAKKIYVQIGTGSRARFFYQEVAKAYCEISEILAFLTSARPALNTLRTK